MSPMQLMHHMFILHFSSFIDDFYMSNYGSGIRDVLKGTKDGVTFMNDKGEDDKKKEKLIIITDDSPTLLINNSDNPIFFKPEDPTLYDKIKYEHNGAYKLNPGESTKIPIDGINIDGTVYKITDGYNNVRILPGGKVEVHYPSIFLEKYYNKKGGIIGSSPDRGWDALFDATKN